MKRQLQRKHVNDMSKHEIGFLRSKIKKLPVWKLTYSMHAKDRMQQRGITYEMIEQTMKGYNIIEFSVGIFNERPDARVRLRSKTPNAGVYVEVLLSLYDAHIITVFPYNTKYGDAQYVRYSKRFLKKLPIQQAYEVLGYETKKHPAHSLIYV